jgi:2-dehydro-3-deoxygalactonokinase
VKQLVALDWGTTSLRAALLADGGEVLHERSMPRGILSVEPGGFRAVFNDICGDWMKDARSFALISGMAGSRQGWLEAPYCPCPAGFADVVAHLASVEAGRIAIVPGLSCEQGGVPDVMRGEETQVFGAMELVGLQGGTFVLPGTHSKWVKASNGGIEGFSTFMTGEIYALLRQHSILSRTMPDADGALDVASFERGVRHALKAASLLQSAFSARTLSLFDRMAAESLPSYLSGLVIGEELRAQNLSAASQEVIVIGTASLAQRYEIALQCVGVRSRSVASAAAWRGLWAIAMAMTQRR